jgi:hypothetical protein
LDRIWLCIRSMPKVIFSIPFTGKMPFKDIDGDEGFKGQNWFCHRSDIFEDYTLKSLINQTDKDFLVWLQFRPKEKTNPVIRKIRRIMKESKLNFVITFNGAILREDKAYWHNEDLVERAKKSLNELGEIEEDTVIEVGLDSDDMVSKNFVEYIKNIEEAEAYYMKVGYIYSTEDGRLAEWNNPESMSIYTINYPTNIFLDADAHFKYQKGFSSHEQIPRIFKANQLPDGMYCATTHGNNISTVWEHPFRGKEIYSETNKKQILSNFK